VLITNIAAMAHAVFSLPLIHMLENRIAKERRAELSRQFLSRRVGDIKTREDNYA
jgi:hypothetical protein